MMLLDSSNTTAVPLSVVLLVCLLEGHLVRGSSKYQQGRHAELRVGASSRKYFRGRNDTHSTTEDKNLTKVSKDEQSPGCGKNGIVGLHTLVHDGITRSFVVVLPQDYSPYSPRSLIMAFHGFNSKPADINTWLSSLPQQPNGPILVEPQGLSTNGLPAGWNGAGSTSNPGPDGQTCHQGTEQYACHSTCGFGCQRCWWTSCADDVGFTLALLDNIKQNLCIAPDKVFATGFSGGAQFTYELASNPRSASQFEAVAIMSGLPHNGFLRFPSWNHAPRLLGVWAGIDAKTQDPQYPPISNIPGRPDKSLDVTYGPQGGYYYSTADNTTRFWSGSTCGSSVNDAANLAAAHALSFNAELSCEAWCDGQVIKCLWASDAHYPMPNSQQLLWHFFTGEGGFAAGASAAYLRRSQR